ncbi:glycoside hydrolase family protein [Massilia sp. S19_KUP03_FR1]|uniref:glycoside hydrolase family protein n=1 Tax=Massilia sp. S19_KUP03_FR1 TaxID=3025503 RepID=UPI002FCDA588
MLNKPAKPQAAAPATPNASMSMSTDARASMRVTEKAIYKYYNDMGKNKGNCTWGAGILAHKGVCSSEELGRLVNAQSVDIVFGQKVAEAERIVRRSIKVDLNQAQFDALCSLTYNAGPTGASDTFLLINRSDFVGAAANINRMIKVSIVKNGKKTKVVARGLIKRRAEESAPFRAQPVAASALSK